MGAWVPIVSLDVEGAEIGPDGEGSDTSDGEDSSDDGPSNYDGSDGDGDEGGDGNNGDSEDDEDEDGTGYAVGAVTNTICDYDIPLDSTCNSEDEGVGLRDEDTDSDEEVPGDAADSMDVDPR